MLTPGGPRARPYLSDLAAERCNTLSLSLSLSAKMHLASFHSEGAPKSWRTGSILVNLCTGPMKSVPDLTVDMYSNKVQSTQYRVHSTECTGQSTPYKHRVQLKVEEETWM